LVITAFTACIDMMLGYSTIATLDNHLFQSKLLGITQDSADNLHIDMEDCI